MYLDIPIFKKCCFCIPLRRGLIAYGYFKVVIMGLLMIAGLITMVMFFTNNVNVKEFTASVIMVVITMLDVIMNIVFLKAAHSKNWKLLKVYYHYFIGFAIVNMFGYCVCAAIQIYTIGKYRSNSLGAWLDFMLWTGVMGMISFVLLVYIISLLRSELIKLQNNCEFRFVNETQEAQCILNVNNDQQFIC